MSERDKAEQAMTRAVRAADEAFMRTGGSSRHWIRDHFVPELAKEGYCIMRIDELNRLQRIPESPASGEGKEK